MRLSIVLLLSIVVTPSYANDVEILDVKLEKKRSSWTARVTLKHEDTGWDHYADGWRIVSSSGKEIAKRVLYHPHVHEQPFTRSLADIKLAENAVVYIEAHDNVHGWSPNRVKVDLSRKGGHKYQVFK